MNFQALRATFQFTKALSAGVLQMSAPGDDSDLPGAVRAVKVKRGNQEYELLADQLSTETLRRIFAVSPDSVWLREEYTGRVYFPDNEGHFRVRETSYSIFCVEGPHVQTTTSVLPSNSLPSTLGPSPSVMSTPDPSSSLVSIPGPSSSVVSTPNLLGSGTMSRSGSQVPPYFKSVIPVGRSKEPTVNLKVILARMVNSKNGKCSFAAQSQMFVELTEGTALVSHILMIARRQWGEHITLVSNDGIEFEDSPGSTGM